MILGPNGGQCGPFGGKGDPVRDDSTSLAITSEDRVIVLAVHPDDESLGAGGLIQHALGCGADVRVVFVTDGDDNPWAQRFVERRWRIGANDRARWGQRRRGEAIAALAQLGVPKENAEFWGFPDQGITSLLVQGGADVARRILDLIYSWEPSILVGPSVNDLHPDHNSLAVLVDMVIAASSPRHRPRVLHYLVHAPLGLLNSPRYRIDLSPEQTAAKRLAILEHHSQMALSKGRLAGFARSEEAFQIGEDPSQQREQRGSSRIEIVEETLIVSAGWLRRPFRILISARGLNGPVAWIVNVPLVGDAEVRDVASGAILDEKAVLAGRTLRLPAESFSGATDIAVKRTDGWGIFDKTGWQTWEGRSRKLTELEGRNFHPRVCCVIPCYNTAQLCGPIVNEAARYSDMVLAIDDGSTDETGVRLQEVADRHSGKVRVLSFSKNMGKGVVMIAAFRHALATLEFDVLVTLDGDGQHRPEDIPRLARELVRGRHALVIGERLVRAPMPLRSRFGNNLTALIMRAFHPAAPTDTQSGYRAFSPEFAGEVAQKIEGGRYETELKILLLALTRKYQIGSVTIPTVYIAGNRLSHFRPLVDSFKIYRTLLSWRAEGPMDPDAAISMDISPRARL